MASGPAHTPDPPDMRHQGTPARADISTVSDADDITYNELLGDERAGSGAPASLAELLSDGFPCGGGMGTLAALATLPDTGSHHAGLRQKVRSILELQQRATAAGQA